jgi:thioredoxin 2
MDAMTTNLTAATFANAVADGPEVIDFSAGWCMPCRAMAPEFERAAGLRPSYRVAKVDVDAEPALAARYGIGWVRPLLVLRDGEPVDAEAGVIGADQLVEALDRIATTTPDHRPKQEAA